MKRFAIEVFILCVLVFMIGLPGSLRTGHALQQSATGTLYVNAATPPHPYFVGLYQNGRAVRTGNNGGDAFFVSFYNVPEGDYELHIDADGYRPQIIHAHVAAGQTTNFSANSPKGEGPPQVWGSGPTLVELIARLSKVETAGEESKKLACKCQK